MVVQKVKLHNVSGLHARPASEFVFVASQYSSRVILRKQGASSGGNGKSIVMVLSLGINQGDIVEITTEGPDEQQAMDALTALIESGLGEE